MTSEELTKIAVVEQEAKAQYRHCINVCMAAGCLSSRADQVKDSLNKEVQSRGLERHCQVRGVGCLGLCSEGPLVNIETKDRGSVMYQTVGSQDAADIVQNLDAQPVQRLVCPTNRPFFKS